MRIEQLQYLVEISKTHSFRLAAENLYVSQPAISDGIKKLEQELGCQLLVRSQTGVSLTPFGLETVALASSVLAGIETITANAAEQRSRAQHLSGDLVIYTTSSISEEFIGQFIASFQRIQPDVHLQLFDANRGHILSALDNQQCDMGFFPVSALELEQLTARDQSLQFIKVAPLNSYALVKKSTALAEKKTLLTKELLKFPLSIIAADETDNMNIAFLFQDSQPQPYIVLRASKLKLILAHVLSGSSIAIVNSISTPDVPEALQAIPLLVSDRLTYYYVYKKNSAKLALLQSYLDLFIPLTRKSLAEAPLS